MSLGGLSRTRDGTVAKILVVGGFGWVGSNVTEALVDLGYDCVLTRHTTTEVPPFLRKHLGRKVLLEPADATSAPDLLRIGEKHKIDGIFCAGRPLGTESKGTLANLRAYFDMITAVFAAAETWNVHRVTMTSTVGVYLGLGPAPMKEDQLLPIPSLGSAGYQKIAEIASYEFARGSGISSVCVRLGGMFGPGMDPRMPDILPRLVHAAARGEPPNLEGLFLGTAADDEIDRPYVKDLGRAIALIQTSEKRASSTYNIGAGKPTSNLELVRAIEQAVPGFKFELPPGRNSRVVMPALDTERLRNDTGFSPKFDVRSGVAEYVDWLKAGNIR
jgi:UDP-glucose 4-epimerase